MQLHEKQTSTLQIYAFFINSRKIYFIFFLLNQYQIDTTDIHRQKILKAQDRIVMHITNGCSVIRHQISICQNVTDRFHSFAIVIVYR